MVIRQYRSERLGLQRKNVENLKILIRLMAWKVFFLKETKFFRKDSRICLRNHLSGITNRRGNTKMWVSNILVFFFVIFTRLKGPIQKTSNRRSFLIKGKQGGDRGRGVDHCFSNCVPRNFKNFLVQCKFIYNTLIVHKLCRKTILNLVVYRENFLTL